MLEDPTSSSSKRMRASANEPSQSSGRGPRRLLHIATSHILFNPNRGDIKLAQVQLLLDRLAERASLLSPSQPGDERGIIVCGDFNAVPQSGMYHFLTHGKIPPGCVSNRHMSGQYLMKDRDLDFLLMDESGHSGGGTAMGVFDVSTGRTAFAGYESDMEMAEALAGMNTSPMKTQRRYGGQTVKGPGANMIAGANHPFHFSSAYAQARGLLSDGSLTTGEPVFTTYHRRFRGTVDYIFFDADVDMHCTGVLEMLPLHTLRRLGSIPHKHWCSDHLSLVASFAWGKAAKSGPSSEDDGGPNDSPSE